MFRPLTFAIPGARPMRGIANGDDTPQAEFVIVEHVMPCGGILREHVWRYPEPAPAAPQEDAHDA